jgi:hypothetical protein
MINKELFKVIMVFNEPKVISEGIVEKEHVNNVHTTNGLMIEKSIITNLKFLSDYINHGKRYLICEESQIENAKNKLIELQNLIKEREQLNLKIKKFLQ